MVGSSVAADRSPLSCRSRQLLSLGHVSGRLWIFFLIFSGRRPNMPACKNLFFYMWLYCLPTNKLLLLQTLDGRYLQKKKSSSRIKKYFCNSEFLVQTFGPSVLPFTGSAPKLMSELPRTSVLVVSVHMVATVKTPKIWLLLLLHAVQYGMYQRIFSRLSEHRRRGFGKCWKNHRKG